MTARQKAKETNALKQRIWDTYKVLPCRCCGETKKVGVEPSLYSKGCFVVMCKECYALTEPAETVQKAIDLWDAGIFPDYINITNKDVPYIDDPEVWKELKNAIVLSVFKDYKKYTKCAMKYWSRPELYDEYVYRAKTEKEFFLGKDFEFFSDISGDKIIEAADKQCKYEYFFRDIHNCNGCYNKECRHIYNIWWLWEKNGKYDACLGFVKYSYSTSKCVQPYRVRWANA